MKKISVIIPSFNAASYVREAIDSVLTQTMQPYEIIVVDDGSVDDTEALLTHYIADHKIRYIKKENGGPGFARNVGIAAAGGEYVAFLDADDVWKPEKLERQMPLFADPEVGLVYSDTEIFGGSTKFKSHSEFSHFERGMVFEKLINANFIPNSSVVVRTSIMQSVGGYDEDKNSFAVEDYFPWLSIARRYKFEFVPDKLVRYRIHAGQISKRNPESYRRLYYIYGKLGKAYGYSFPVLRKYLENRVKFIIATIAPR